MLIGEIFGFDGEYWLDGEIFGSDGEYCWYMGKYLYLMVNNGVRWGNIWIL